MKLGSKLEEVEFQSHIIKKFPYEDGKHWNSLPKDGIEAPRLEVIKAGLDGALKSQSSRRYLCYWQGAWNKMILKVPST